MGDENYGFALIAHRDDRFEEVMRFHRGKHGGRFIQYQDIGLSEKRLDNLHPLLLPHGKIRDPLI